MDFKIRKIIARQVLDSRGNPTVEVGLKTKDCCVRSIVPSGASMGIHESLELRDNNPIFYNGKSILKAVNNVNSIISKKIIGKDCRRQREIDNFLIELDGTKNKCKLGANAILPVSMAVCKAGAEASGVQLYEYIQKLSDTRKLLLPIPQMNVINGGRHAGIANDIQEHMILPTDFNNFSDALRAGVETYHKLKNILRKGYGATATLVGDEGGFVPKIENVEHRLELLMEAIKEAGYHGKMKLALDSAASEFYDEENNEYTILNKKFNAGELIDLYKDLIKKFPIVSIEDGFAQDDWQGWKQFNQELGNKIQIVGDDLLVTNIMRIRKALEEKSCNALLLKVNQIGTVTESIDAANISFKNNWNVVVSHRSGETEDTFIADLAVGIGSNQSKFGAPARSERVAKYNRLLRIEEKLGKKAKFAKF
ncbi:MAG TPA: phosphopyruvate hydratase [Candidatus Nanoarchaeia archaeon]|nr:phosphopyruvate hydratase [Candidatus Nanoarchaeia archaeon]